MKSITFLIYYTIWLICSLFITAIIFLINERKRDTKSILIKRIMILVKELIELESQKKQEEEVIYTNFEKVVNDYIIKSSKKKKQDKTKEESKPKKKKVIAY